MRRTIFTLFLLLSAVMVFADGDERSQYTKLDKEGQKIYDEARANRTSPRCLELSRQLYAFEQKRGDKFGMCRALCLPVQYWYLKRNEREFMSAVNDLRQTARNFECTALLYYSYFEEIDYYLITNRSLRALHLVNDLTKQLQTMPSVYGSYLIDVALGNIYFARRDEHHAGEYYLSAIKKSEIIKNSYDLPIVYLNLARITEVHNIANRERYLNLALQNSVNPTDSAAALMGLAHLYSYTNNNGKFWDMYKEYRPMLAKENLSQVKFEKWYKANEAFRMTLENMPDSAMKMRQSITDPYSRYQAQADYYRSLNDNTMVNLYLDSLVMYMRSSQASQNVSDVAEMSAIYETEKLRNDASELKQGFLRNSLVVVSIALAIIIIALIYWNSRRNKMMRKMTALSEELRTARDEAVQASKMKDVFIQNMSHEIRTPLNAVTGFAQLLALPDDFLEPGDREQFIEHINNNTRLLTMLIDDILNLSDIEAGNYKIELAQCSVNNICRTAISTVQTRLTDDVELKFTTSVEDDFCVNTDARRVQQVLINYLTNAIKHTEKGHILVHVSLKERPGMVTFSVSDTGTGVPPEKSNIIFQRFEKLNAFVQGTGLGLNICRIIADRLHGDCSLDTTYPQAYANVEHGARFIFAIPV